MKLEVNKIVTLGNGEEYLVIDKVEKDNKEYYYVAEVNEDGTDIKDKFAMVHEFEKDGEEYIEMVKDQKTMQVLLSHLNFEEE